ncbi:hypothetical protein, partial [Paracoccus fontiphilus]
MSYLFRTVFRYKTARFQKALLGRAIFAELPMPELEARPIELPCRPGLYEPDQLNRVRSCNRGHSLASMMEVWTQTRWIERPLEIYRLGSASIVEGVIATKYALHWMALQKPRLADAVMQAPVSDETVITNSMQGLEFFGHWLGDDCAAYEAFRDHPDLKSMCMPAWNDLPFFQQAFNQQWNQNALIQSKNLILLRALGFDRRKAERYRILRSRLRAAYRDAVETGKVVFIRRGASAKPRATIANEAELLRHLEDRGITIVTPEGNTGTFTMVRGHSWFPHRLISDSNSPKGG